MLLLIFRFPASPVELEGLMEVSVEGQLPIVPPIVTPLYNLDELFVAIEETVRAYIAVDVQLAEADRA